MNSNQQALWARLEAFVGQIKTRHGEIMREAEAGCRELIANDPTDPMPLGNAIHAIDHRFDQLTRKLEDTWSDKIMDMFVDANGRDGKFVDRGIDYIGQARLDLEAAWMRLKIKLAADAYRALWPIASVEMMKPVNCNNCGMELQPPVRHQSVTVNCPGCNSAVQCIPHKAVYSYYGGGGHAFGEEAAVEQRIAIEQFRFDVDRERRDKDWEKEAIESLDRWEQMEIQYWTSYGQMRGQISGETPEQINAFIKSRVDQFRQFNLLTEQHWRRAKGL